VDHLIDCPACEGRGIYCLRADDPAWSELVVSGSPCDLCNGLGKITQDSIETYNQSSLSPFFPYGDL
jgi:hypothetical protein